ncbi:MAG: FecR domain-containing protein [Sandaracinaceae bacterium]
MSTSHDEGARDYRTLAAELKDGSPAPDALTRARMEQRLVSARRAPARSSRGPIVFVAGLGLAAAAAIALFVSAGDPDEASPTVARFEVREVGAASQRGTLEEGSVLRTGAGEVADVRIVDSRVHLEPGTEVRIATLAEGRLAIELAHGEVLVEFHPRRRGEEHLSVSTSEARVEVVGTVFRVRAGDASTTVSVSEGRVRVVPQEDERGERAVSAGESWTVEARLAQLEPEEEPIALAPPSEEAVPVPPEPVSPPAPRAPSPSAQLARARGLVQAGDAEGAEVLLRSIADGPGSNAVRAEALTRLGDLLRRTRPHDAESAYQRAASTGEGEWSAMADYALGRLRWRELGQPDLARESYRRYLERAPNGALAAQARAALCSLGDASSCTP